MREQTLATKYMYSSRFSDVLDDESQLLQSLEHNLHISPLYEILDRLVIIYNAYLVHNQVHPNDT